MSAIIRTHENYLRSKCPKLDHMFMHTRSVAHTETELIESASLRQLLCNYVNTGLANQALDM